MASFWGERRFLVPGLVFLAALLALAAMSGVFKGLDAKGADVGVAAIAAVLAGGLAGYPLGLLLNIPYDFVFRTRWLIGHYDRFTHYDEFCAAFSNIASTEPAAALQTFQRECRSLHERWEKRRFFGFFYGRFAPASVRSTSEGRWETVHTMGGMAAALLFALLLSPLAVLPFEHQTPWWDQRLTSWLAPLIVVIIIALMAVRGWIVATEAGYIQRRWGHYFVQLLQREPGLLERAAVES